MPRGRITERVGRKKDPWEIFRRKRDPDLTLNKKIVKDTVHANVGVVGYKPKVEFGVVHGVEREFKKKPTKKK